MSLFARRIAELRLAGMLLTRVPMGTLRDPVPSLPDSRWAFPVVGIIIGALVGTVFSGATAIGLTPVISALLALGVGVMLTGGLHEDGLADLADGFGGGQTRARKLEIMRDSRIGSYGVLALIIVLGLKALAMAEAQGIWVFIAIGAGSRACMLAVLELVPPAREDGMGQSAAQPGGWRFNVGLGLACLALIPLGAAGLWVALAMIGPAVALALISKRQIGGQTGDVLGATQSVADCGGWLCASVVLSLG